jgi:two-component system, cell cycle sensor histidine kinase and response regulator CckA
MSREPGSATRSPARELALIFALFALVVTTLVVVTNVAVQNLSAIRAYVAGEGRWSKAQQRAVLALQHYALTGDASDFLVYEREVAVTLGDRRARETLQSAAPDLAVAREGFLAGRNHPDDIDGMIRLFRWFRAVPDVARAIEIWTQGDQAIDRLRDEARALREAMAAPEPDRARVRRVLDAIDRSDRELSRLEDDFSSTLGRVARWATAWIAVLTLGAAVLLLALAGYFSRRVLRRLARSEAALRRSEAHLQEAQRMRAVGQLAGGIAHDFNNLLTVIIGYGDELTQTLARPDPRHEAAAEIVHAANRAADLTRQLLAFSRRQVIDPTAVDVNAVVLGMRAMLDRLIGTHIELLLQLSDEGVHARADASQLEQVILNLVVNARDAMQEGGRLTIATSRARRTGAGPASPSDLVCLTVADTGVGMNADTSARIFEPFFTTKGVGKGTGLGLSVVYGIVEQYGGRIDVDSEPGCGTRFDLWLPACEAAAEPVTLPAPSIELRGDERILLVEDEDPVRVLAQATLERLGYRVLAARNGEEGLAMVERYSASLDLVVTDVVMPKMGGRALAGRLAERYPRIRVLYVSGYASGRDLAAPIGAAAGPPLLYKPFTAHQLASRVRETLDAVGEAAQARA